MNVSVSLLLLFLNSSYKINSFLNADRILISIMTYKTPTEIIKGLLTYCTDTLGYKLLTINDIGVERPKPSLTNPPYITLRALNASTTGAGFDVMNHYIHVGMGTALDDCIEAGYPELTLDCLISDEKYLDKRERGITIGANEEYLKRSLEALSKKYSLKQVKEFKEKFKLTDL